MILKYSTIWILQPLVISGCVVECRICNWDVAGSNLGRGYFALHKVYSAFHPSGVGKWVPVIGMAHSECGWTCGCAGKTVKSLENTCHTRALLRWWFTTKRCYIKTPPLPLPLHTCCRVQCGYSHSKGRNKSRHSSVCTEWQQGRRHIPR